VSDRAVREAIRRFQADRTVAAGAALLRARLRAGELTEDRLRIAADLGNGPARAALGVEGPAPDPVRSRDQLLERVERLAERDPWLAGQAAVIGTAWAIDYWTGASPNDAALRDAHATLARIVDGQAGPADAAEHLSPLRQSSVYAEDFSAQVVEAIARPVRAAAQGDSLLDVARAAFERPANGPERTWRRVARGLTAWALDLSPVDPLARLGARDPLRIVLVGHFAVPAETSLNYDGSLAGQEEVVEVGSSCEEPLGDRSTEPLPAEEAFSALADLRRRFGWDRSIVVYLTHRPDPDRWFARHAPGRRDAVVYLDRAGVQQLRTPFEVVAAHLVAKKALDVLLAEEGLSLVHREPTGCLFDRCRRRPDLDLRIRAGFVCGRCREHVRGTRIPSALLRRLDIVLAGLRSRAIEAVQRPDVRRLRG